MFGGGFGAPAAGGFGAPAAGGFGKAPAAGGFGAPAPAAGGFGAPAAGGFGAPAAGGFGAPAAGGFGKAPAAGGFGAPAPAAGGFGAPAAGGFGAAPAAGGFGAPAAGGFGKAPAAGGFGAPAPAAGGFGAPAAPGGFGAAPAAGGFGAPAAGGFGKAPAAGGFGAPAPAAGFGAPAAGGFGKAPAAGGFGAPAPAAGGFGAPAAGGFGAPAAGGFGAAPAAGGFGAPAAGGFGAPAAGGFGKAPVAGGFGAPAPATGFGAAPAAGGFGAPAAGGFGAAPAGVNNNLAFTQQETQSLVQQLLKIPNYADTPYGNVLLFADEGGKGDSAAATRLDPRIVDPALSGGLEGAVKCPIRAHRPAPPLRIAAPAGYGGSSHHSVMTTNSVATVYTRQSLANASAVAATSVQYAMGTAHNNKALSLAAATATAPTTAAIQPRSVSTAVFMDALNSTYMRMGVTADGRTDLGAGDASAHHLRVTADTPVPHSMVTVAAEEGGAATAGHYTTTTTTTTETTTTTHAHHSHGLHYDSAAAAFGAAANEEIPPQAPRCANNYYVLTPSIRALQSGEFSNEALRSVHNFAIATTDGKVTIRFLDPVNLFAADIDALVSIEPNGRVTMFPNAPRPLAGKGLNVPAVVTVRDMVVDDEGDLREECDVEGNTFVSYSAATREWKYIINSSNSNANNNTNANVSGINNKSASRGRFAAAANNSHVAAEEHSLVDDTPQQHRFAAAADDEGAISDDEAYQQQSHVARQKSQKHSSGADVSNASAAAAFTATQHHKDNSVGGAAIAATAQQQNIYNYHYYMSAYSGYDDGTTLNGGGSDASKAQKKNNNKDAIVGGEHHSLHKRGRHVVAVCDDVDFKLPFELPKLEGLTSANTTTKCAAAAKPLIFTIPPQFETAAAAASEATGATATTGCVLIGSDRAALVREAWAPSSAATTAVKSTTTTASAATANVGMNADRFLGRSFRVGFAPDGRVALPRFSALHDGCAKTSAVSESNAGATVDLFAPIATIPSTPVATAVRVLTSIRPFVSSAAASSSSSSSSAGITVDLGLAGSPIAEAAPVASSSSSGAVIGRALSVEKVNAIVEAVSAVIATTATVAAPHHHGGNGTATVSYPATDARGPVQHAALKQLFSLLTLSQSLHGISEADAAFDSAVEEHEYDLHLRRRNLGEWLEREIRSEGLLSAAAAAAAVNATATTSSSADSKKQQQQTVAGHRLGVLMALLENNPSKAALLSARLPPTDDFRRIVTMCARGHTAAARASAIVGNNAASAADGSAEAKRYDEVVRVLIGEASPFVNRPCVLKPAAAASAAALPKLRPDAVSWKQLLGVFAFYGCAADAGAETVVSHFSQRVRDRPAASASDKDGNATLMPQYAAAALAGGAADGEEDAKETIRPFTDLGAKRTNDIVNTASSFEDSCLHLLSAFAAHRCPSPLLLHPLSSTYYNTDAFIPFLMLLVVRNIYPRRDQRSAAFREREAETIIAFSTQIEQCATAIANEGAVASGAVKGASAEAFGAALWWALFVLHLIEEQSGRDEAIAAFVRRHLRFMNAAMTTASSSASEPLVGGDMWKADASSPLSLSYCATIISQFVASGESDAVCADLASAAVEADSAMKAVRTQLLQSRLDCVDGEVNRPSLGTHRAMREAMRRFASDLK